MPLKTNKNLNTDSNAIPAIGVINMLGCFEIDCNLFIASDQDFSLLILLIILSN